MRRQASLIAAMTALLFAAPLPLQVQAASAPSGNPSRGAEIYESHCGACHSLDANRVGPMHRGVFGRKAGIVPGYNYTHALKTSGIVWTAPALDRWLSGPSKMVPGTAMGFSLSSAQDRADVIAYLKSKPK
jgi:cytochrome c